MFSVQWYKINGKAVHRGAGTNQEQVIFVLVNDPVHALDIYQILPGVARDRIPTIIPATEEETSDMEAALRNRRYSEYRGVCIVKYY